MIDLHLYKGIHYTKQKQKRISRTISRVLWHLTGRYCLSFIRV